MIRNDPHMTAKINSFVNSKTEEYICLPFIQAAGEEAVHLEFYRYGADDTFSIDLPLDVARHLGASILRESFKEVEQKYQEKEGRLSFDDACCYYCSWTTGDSVQSISYGLNEELRIALMVSNVDTTKKVSFRKKASHHVVYCPEDMFYSLGRDLRLTADGIRMAQERKILGL